MKTNPVSQQVLNTFVKNELFKSMKFLPTQFHLYDTRPGTPCGIIMERCKTSIPSDRSEKEYWEHDLVPALVYKMQMFKNQRLQRMKMLFNCMSSIVIWYLCLFEMNFALKT